jgi:hypothetical protein
LYINVYRYMDMYITAIAKAKEKMAGRMARGHGGARWAKV